MTGALFILGALVVTALLFSIWMGGGQTQTPGQDSGTGVHQPADPKDASIPGGSAYAESNVYNNASFISGSTFNTTTITTTTIIMDPDMQNWRPTVTKQPVPLDITSSIDRGQAFFEADNYDQALKAFDQALQDNPKDARAWERKGSTLAQLGQGDEALQCFDRALKINPYQENALHNKGNTLRMMGRYFEALHMFDKTLDLYPENQKVWANKGMVLARLGRFDEALEDLDVALMLKPGDTYALAIKAQVKHARQKAQVSVKPTVRPTMKTPSYYPGGRPIITYPPITKARPYNTAIPIIRPAAYPYWGT